MDDLFRSYWWLLFPLGFFIFGAFDRWLTYKRSKDHLDLLRSYAAQGKDPPPELVRIIRDEAEAEDDYNATHWGDGSRHSHRRYRAHLRYRFSPYHQWRSAVTTGAVAIGFWIASEYAGWPGIEEPFRLVAIIMTCVAVGIGISALFATVFRGK